MSHSDFICQNCGYESDVIQMSCPRCGEVPQAAPYVVTRDVPLGAPLFATASDEERQRVQLIGWAKTTFLIVGALTLFLMIPFFAIPLMQGPDNYGYYRLPRGRGETVSRQARGDTLQIAAVAMLLFSGVFFGGYFILKRIHEAKLAAMEPDGLSIAGSGDEQKS
jgi:hypothetical protein